MDVVLLIIKYIVIVLAVLFVVLKVVAMCCKKGTIYENEPKQKNSMEGKKVIFVKDESEAKNADGERGHLEAVGNSEYNGQVY